MASRRGQSLMRDRRTPAELALDDALRAVQSLRVFGEIDARLEGYDEAVDDAESAIIDACRARGFRVELVPNGDAGRPPIATDPGVR